MHFNILCLVKERGKIYRKSKAERKKKGRQEGRKKEAGNTS